MSTTTRIRIRRAALAGAGAAAALVLAGCAGPVTVGLPGTTAAPSTSTSTAPTPAAPGGGASASADPGGGGAPSPSASTVASTGYRTARCTADHLRGGLGDSDGAAGSTIVDLQLQNTGSTTCTLQGWPGVSFVDGSGKQIGAAADFDRASAHETVTLMPNGHAHASLKIAQALNYPSAKCRPVKTTHLRVYPPGSYDPVSVTIPATTACRDSSEHLLTVQALHATT